MNTLIIALVLGMLIGCTGVIGDRLGRIADGAAMWTLMLMLTLMGVKLSAPGVVSHLGAIGLRAVVIAGASVVGSILAVGLVSVAGFRRRKAAAGEAGQLPSDEEAETA